uniref:Secreted protein n=1 Tax=Anguilla anguilla TaxID=7936 RepID=A0A0E9T9U3_ANGAN
MRCLILSLLIKVFSCVTWRWAARKLVRMGSSDVRLNKMMYQIDNPSLFSRLHIFATLIYLRRKH